MEAYVLLGFLEPMTEEEADYDFLGVYPSYEDAQDAADYQTWYHDGYMWEDYLIERVFVKCDKWED